MCDCYEHKCAECDEVLDMHLEDYSTDRDEIEVFCDKHIPENLDDGILWEWSDEVIEEPKEWRKIFVRCLTKNARCHSTGNHPNTWQERRIGGGVE